MGILGKKLGMTQIITEKGKQIPVSVIDVEGVIVTELKTEDKHGYNAVQLGYGNAKNIKKPQKKAFEKKEIEPKKHLKEFKDLDVDKYNIGDSIDFEDISKFVKIRGKTKGKGFQGTIKRYKASTGRKTHGSHFHRAPGSIGASADPAKVVKGMPMAGQMGNKYRTIENLEVVKKDEERNLLFIKGAVPGANGTILYIFNSSENNA
ncbi:MAG: 50S ribosomal protein L3 [Candidatus Mcinerneyibacterium aminivorans]|uniref:Large ribosomal subunit protein uL3 n=1 Tax=Candidatus Mcinerneyibacterium aminivorans TaxID=2703815 RepID=A0A5D0MG06_9BACT|nr:MAG: 50S ribosomal protein L3 [Candidatus Mcinerneyibacterium aminivorans]